MSFDNFREDICVICGNYSCVEAYDHQKINQKDFLTFFHQNKVTNEHTHQILEKVTNHYQSLLESIINMIKQDQKKVLGKIKSMEYLFLQNKKLSMNLVEEICSENYKSLPTKRLLPIIEEMKKPLPKSSQISKQTELQKLINKYLETETVSHQLQKFQENLLYPLIIEQEKRRASLRRKVSIRKIENPEEIQKNEEEVILNIKGMVLKQNFKEITLNNRAIEDRQLVDHINSFKRFQNLQKLEIRNNKITFLSCRILANNLSHLKKLDIRGNKVKNEGIISISKKLKNLTEFYACETGIDDTAVVHIYQNLKELILLYMQRNNITSKGLQTIVHLDKIKSLGLVGNKISVEQLNRIRTLHLRGKILHISV